MEKAPGVVFVVMRDVVGGGCVQFSVHALAILALRTALQDWSLAIVSKCVFILPLVDSILKRG
jgi:hypothetical protein